MLISIELTDNEILNSTFKVIQTMQLDIVEPKLTS